jgi:hypothetical protein
LFFSAPILANTILTYEVNANLQSLKKTKSIVKTLIANNLQLAIENHKFIILQKNKTTYI